MLRMETATDQDVVRFGSFRLELAAGRLWDGDDPVTLRPKTWQVLRHLVENSDRLVTKHELLDAFWADVAVEEKAVNTCIGEIRAALGDSSRRPRFVETVQRRGFRFLASPRAEPVGRVEPGRSTFVGRRGELETLVAKLSDPGAGTTMVVVSGAAGIGKTRLVSEAVEIAGARALVGQCIEGGGLPYLPWIEMIRERLRRGATVDWSSAPDTTVAELARLIPGLQVSPDRVLQPGTDPELARIRLFEAIAAFFEAASASQPMVLVLEDLHWGDAASLHALQALLPRLAASKARVVATLRDEDAEPGSTVRTSLEALRRRGLVEFVPLGGLGAAETRELVAGLAGPSIAADLVDKIADGSEGSPFFVEEILRHYRNDTAGTGAGDPTAGSHSGLFLPDNVVEMFERRLRRLSPVTRRLVEAVAVAGRECDESLLEHVLAIPDDELADAVGEAIEHDVLRENPARPGRYGLVHALMSVAIHQRLAGPRRRGLHRDLAEAVAATRGDTDERVAEVARHLALAFPSVRAELAIDALVEASDLAASGLAYEDAIELCAKALAIARTADADGRRRLPELAVRHAEALQKIGDAEAVAVAFREAAEFAREAVEPQWFARAALGMATLWEFEAPDVRGYLEEALRGLGDGQSAPGARDSADGSATLEARDFADAHAALRARLLARLAMVLYPLADTRPRCEELTAEAVATARRVGDPTLLAQTLVDWLAAQWYQDNLAAQDAVSEELLDVAQRSGDGALTATALGWRVVIALCSGEIRRAQEYATALLELADRLGQPLYRWCGLYLNATLAILGGELSRAEGLANEAFAVGRSASPQSATIVYFTQMLSIRREQDRIGELLPMIEQDPGRMSGDAILWNLPHFYLEADRRDDGAAAFARACALGFDAMPGQNSRNRRLLTLGAMSLACAALDDKETGARLYGIVKPDAGRWAVAGFGGVSYGLLENAAGALATALGDYDSAAAHFDHAIAEYERTGVRIALARACYLYAAMCLRRGASGDDGRAEALLERATALAEEFGLVRVQTLVRRLRSGESVG